MAALNIDPALLEGYALESGATLRRANGEVFNASGRKGVYQLPKQAAPVAPAPQDQSLLLEKLVQMLGQMQQPQAPVVHSAPAQVVIQPAARVSWDFTFTRNRDGSIQSITANPKE